MDRCINLIVKPTDACNLRCKHCYANSTNYCDNKMDINTIEKLYDLLSKKYNKIHTIWHGGEPLLMGISFYEKIVDIQKKYLNIKFSNSIQSNITLINKDWINFFKKENFKLGISFDGPYNHILRSKGKNVIENIKLLKKETYNFGTIAVVCSKTIDKMIEIYEYFKKLNISYKLSPLFDSGVALEHQELSIFPDDYVKYYLEFFKYWLLDKECNIMMTSNLEFLSLYFNLKQTSCIYTSCLTKWISIHFDGSIYPCGRDFPKKYLVGNINDFNDIDEIFLSEPYQVLLDGAIKRREKCLESCEFFSKCRGGCNNNAILSGDISKNNYKECLIFKKSFQGISAILDEFTGRDIQNVKLLNPSIVEYLKTKGVKF